MASYWKPAAQLVHRQQVSRYYEWRGMTRDSRRAAILWSGLVPKETRQAMAELTDVGKAAPKAAPLLSDATRGATSPLGGQAKR